MAAASGAAKQIAGKALDAERHSVSHRAEISAQQAGNDRLAVIEPGRAAEEAGPVGQHEGELGPDHAAAERAQGNGGQAAAVNAQRLPREQQEAEPGRPGRQHDGCVGPVHASFSGGGSASSESPGSSDKVGHVRLADSPVMLEP